MNSLKIARSGMVLAVLLVLMLLPGSGMAAASSAGGPLVMRSAADRSPADLLKMAVEKAQAAGGYRLRMDVQQTILAPTTLRGLSAAVGQGLHNEQSARLRIEGQIGGQQQARLLIQDGEIRGRLPHSPVLTPSGGQEILVTGQAVYQREGDIWMRQPDAIAAPGLTGDALLLLEIARNVTHLDPIQTLGGSFERLSFTLDSRDVLAYMLRRRGTVDPQTQTYLALSGLEYNGTGELWVDSEGLPARLELNLSLARGGRDPYQAHAASTATYTDFGGTFPAGWFDPTRAPISRVSTSPIPGSGLTTEQLTGIGLLGVVLKLEVALLFVLLRMRRRTRHAYAALSVVLIISLLSPIVAQAAPPSRAAQSASSAQAQPSATETMLRNARALGDEQRARVASLASELDPMGDEDGDGLPNGYELKLGTNPFLADSDFDGLTDYEEVVGINCFNGTTFVRVETDPLNPDSNYDGIRDGDEFDRGACRFTENGRRPFAWDDDNDSDGVPDDLDLSPFTVSQTFREVGANLTFEAISDPTGAAPREVYYFEVQVVPEATHTLQYAYKDALEWPVDDKGMVQNDPNSGTTGRLEIAPFLEVTLVDDDLPSGNALSSYGIGAAPVPTEDGEPSGESTLVIPLAPIERGGKIYALQAKLYQDRTSSDGVLRWRNVRLKWAVQGDVLRADDDGNMVPSPTGSYGLIIYDEPYRITGVQTSRQGGAASSVVGAVRTADAGKNAAHIALLRGALETQYLGGRLNLTDIYNRFGLNSSAPIEHRWGITQTFSVSLPQQFRHVDQMLLTTNVTTTRELLNTYYTSGADRPTLLIATEQRTATHNVDDVPNPNFSDLVMNVCVAELVTSRTLKLAKYEWDPTVAAAMMAPMRVSSSQNSPAAVTTGDWTMLGLDEVLSDIKTEFDALYGTLEDAYSEALTVLQMAMTAWYQGQTVVQSIGGLDLTNVTADMSDPAFYANILSLLADYGLFDGLPSEFRTAVEFLLGVLDYPGGPAQWLADQWNSVVSTADTIVGSFKSFAAGDFTPDSLVSFTQTAINVLTWLASILNLGFLGEAVKLLTRLLEIFTKVQQLWNTIQVLAEQGIQVAGDVLKAVTGELTSLAGNLQFVGLILSVFTTLFSMFMQLAAGTLSVLGVIGVILQAVVEIAITIVLFVVSTLFPIGTLVAIGIAIVKLITNFLKDYLGDVGTVIAAILDPLGALFDALNPDPEPLAVFYGVPQVSSLKFSTFEGEPLGGLVAGDRFGFNISGIATMAGANTALNTSSAFLQLGRYAKGESFELCGLEIIQYLMDTGQLDQAPNYTNAITKGTCRTFRLAYEPTWTYTRDNAWSQSSIYITDKIPGTNIPSPVPARVRDYYSASKLIIDPRKPAINGVVSTDVTMEINQLWENCGIAGLDCDRWVEHWVTKPSANYVYFDILPRTLSELWNWEDLINRDPDGDGLIGNPDQGVIGFDVGLCNNPNSHRQLDSGPATARDGLSDFFELFRFNSSPCQGDTDGDGLNDYWEYMIGTDPRNPDTDGDGLTDGEEVARWFPNGTALIVPWRVDMGGAYLGLPNPAAFPNPRLANADGDARSDKKEKEMLSSPNAFDVSDIEVAISQELVQGGGTRIRLTSFPWPNDAAPGLSPILSLTLPIGFSNVTTQARLVSKGFTYIPAFGTPVPGTPPNVYAWTFPPLSLNRLVEVTFTGLPTTIPADEVLVTVDFSYSEAGVPRQTQSTAPLKINRGGPETIITWPVDDVLTSAYYGPIRIQGTADDAEGVSSVQVCVTAGSSCGTGGWQNASIGSLYALGWTYNWTPPGDGTYRAFARSVDAFGVAGPTTAAVTFSVDSVPPAGASFDLSGTVFLSTTLSTSSLAAFTVTGQIADGAGSFISGVGGAQVTALLTTPDGTEVLRGTSTIANPGAPSSAFQTVFALPMMPFFDGAASPYAQGLYQLSLSANDRAGNVRSAGDTLSVLVDDTPPFIFARVPQTVLGPSIDLGGRADDTALSLRRASQSPYTTTQTLAAHNTYFDVSTTTGRAYVVGDLNGDTLDDVVLVTWVPGQPLMAGIFFGRVGGFQERLAPGQADVILAGETDIRARSSPVVAINAPSLLDVNGDGIADLVIGDPNVNSGEGRAYVLLGRRDWPENIALADADWRLSLPRTFGFGSAVAGAGDVDGDGLTDLVIGAPEEAIEGGGAYSEVMYLYLGRERGVPELQARFYGRSCRAGCDFPRSPNLAGIGDTDGDGLSDVLLAGNGTIWLIPGQATHDLRGTSGAEDVAIAAMAVTAERSAQQAVSPAGDVNGDGLRDMLIGDPYAGESARVFVVFGRRPEQGFPRHPATFDLINNADLSFFGLVDGVRYRSMGESLTPMGDLDRDGKDDFAFGSTGVSGGASIVLSGKTPWQRDLSPAIAAYHIVSTEGGFEAGRYLSSGDVDGDGIRDILVGAPGVGGAYLFQGTSPRILPSGVARVEVGVVGPITEPWKPITETLPTTWLPASLMTPDGGITTFSVALTFAADGDYRIYARATDHAHNRLPAEAWYLGTTFVNRNIDPIPGIAGTLDTPVLTREGFLRVELTGAVSSPAPIQHLRSFDGERWTRLPLTASAPGAWANESNIKRSDQRAITFRAVARDAFGNVAHAVRTVITDTLVAAPELSANLPTESWNTDTTPTLTITWPAVGDAGGPVTQYATIDQNSDTLPTAPNVANQISHNLTVPGVWYAHVRVVDSAGNERTVHTGPFGANRSRTPSVILPDGRLDFDGGEYLESMAPSYDPYASIKPALLLTTWNANTLFLGFTGTDWSTEKRFVVYLDTGAGGLTTSLGSTLPGGEPDHTLPFTADIALVVDGPSSSTLYEVVGSAWVQRSNPLSFAATANGTEIALDRGEIGAVGAVSLLAYVATADGVAAVIPTGARPSTDDLLVGPVTFLDALQWGSLRNGYPADESDLPVQRIAPLVSVDPGYTSRLNPGGQAKLSVTVVNPDILPYERHRMTVTLGTGTPLLTFASLDSGAISCVSCPPTGADEWVVEVNVEREASKTIVFTVEAQTPSMPGIYPVPVAATLAYQGLPSAPQPPAIGAYTVNYSVAQLNFAALGTTIFTKPGTFRLPIFVNTGTAIATCKQQVSINRGAGWELLGGLGAVSSVTSTVPSGYSAVWQLRVTADNGLASTTSITVTADSTPPEVQMTTARTISQTLGLLRGTAVDNSGQFSAVEVSLNRRPFRRAILMGDGSVRLSPAQSAEGPVAWAFPVTAHGTDGETIEVVARAADAAGNVGPASPPMMVVLDATGPSITIAESLTAARGAVTDGSGVDQVQVSLDGGITYQDTELSGETWSFDYETWSGGTPVAVVVIRAVDIHGNVSQAVARSEAAAGPDGSRIYLPLVMR